MSATRLAYTFGNHMHWVDMQWLWGYHVLPGSVRDMLHFCRETGAKGGVNFDGIGYEKLACEHPEAFAELRAAIQAGTIEVVGGSYGQPYGLFHGGESNVRQRIYGVRTAERLFGVRPKTFWEEEFDCYPQLPQILRQCGFDGASLYFQWTWHTPEVPKEYTPVIWWEGHDGTRIKTATRNRLNVHQWPEDIAILMDDLASNPPTQGLILQWLELMPSPDWMCRSEVLLPKTKELLSDPRFEFDLVTLGEYLASAGEDWPVRKYSLTDTWHGMSLGKNGDRHPKTSARVQREIQLAEALHSMLGWLGRPYSQWDVYPAWELEEAWRYLLMAQHHDNHECEGLCGGVGYIHMDAAEELADADRALGRIQDAMGGKGLSQVVVNGAGWATQWYGVDIPPFGWAECPDQDDRRWVRTERGARVDDPSVDIEVDIHQWVLRVGENSLRLPKVRWQIGGRTSETVSCELDRIDIDGETLCVLDSEKGEVCFWIRYYGSINTVSVEVSFEPSSPLDPGLIAAAMVVWPDSGGQIRVDHPYGVSAVEPHGKWPRKYPEGDWMTSAQWFETVENPFTSQTFVDDVAAGWLVAHEGNQQWFRTPDGLASVIVMNDPWDGALASSEARARYRLIPHGPIRDSDRVRLAAPEALCCLQVSEPTSSISFVHGLTDNVLLTALYRETQDRRVGLPPLFEHDYPFVLRLVEYDGLDTEMGVWVRGTVAKAFRTNLLGEPLAEIIPEAARDGSLLKFPMGAHEIATLTFDVVEARKQVRDLDAKREIWATVHRTAG